MPTITPEPEPVRVKPSPSLMRMAHDMRYAGQKRQTKLWVAVTRMGYVAGKFGSRESRCPIRGAGKSDGWPALRFAWVDGWIKGWNEFAALREPPEPPRPDRRPRKRRRRAA